MSDSEENENHKGSGMCKKCVKKVKNTDNGISCENCEWWFHAGCGGVSASLYKALKANEDQPWFCRDCNSNVKAAIKDCEMLKRENKSLKEKNSEMKLYIEELEEKFNQLKVEIMQDVTKRVMDEVGKELAGKIPTT